MLIYQIKQMLADKLGQPITYPYDCELLRNDIFSHTKLFVGVTTLKRLLGFVKPHGDRPYEPRTYTLDVIARYLGHPDYATFIASLDPDMPPPADNHEIELIQSECLDCGSLVSAEWPGGHALFKACGDCNFRLVEISAAMKLNTGTVYNIKSFRRGMPLYLRSTQARTGVTNPVILAHISGISRLSLI